MHGFYTNLTIFEISVTVNLQTRYGALNLYPNDKGIDYKINELRGIWVVEMNKK